MEETYEIYFGPFWVRIDQQSDGYQVDYRGPDLSVKRDYTCIPEGLAVPDWDVPGSPEAEAAIREFVIFNLALDDLNDNGDPDDWVNRILPARRQLAKILGV